MIRGRSVQTHGEIIPAQHGAAYAVGAERSHSDMKIENLFQYAPLAVGLMEIEH